MNEIVAYTKNVTNKLPTDLRGWVAIAESSHWLVWPHGQSKKKNEQCSPTARMQIFGSEFNIKKATYL